MSVLTLQIILGFIGLGFVACLVLLGMTNRDQADQIKKFDEKYNKYKNKN